MDGKQPCFTLPFSSSHISIIKYYEMKGCKEWKIWKFDDLWQVWVCVFVLSVISERGWSNTKKSKKKSTFIWPYGSKHRVKVPREERLTKIQRWEGTTYYLILTCRKSTSTKIILWIVRNINKTTLTLTYFFRMYAAAFKIWMHPRLTCRTESDGRARKTFFIVDAFKLIFYLMERITYVCIL